jgi:hypothetical protein
MARQCDDRPSSGRSKGQHHQRHDGDQRVNTTELERLRARPSGSTPFNRRRRHPSGYGERRGCEALRNAEPFWPPTRSE